jgi:hypothetical protein
MILRQRHRRRYLIVLRAISGVAPAPWANERPSLPELTKGIDMKKITVVCAALLGALTTPAFADGWRFVDGEAVWAYSSETRNNETREQVPRERSDIARNPAATGGWKQVDGEAGWLYVGPQTERRTSRSRASTATSNAIR